MAVPCTMPKERVKRVSRLGSKQQKSFKKSVAISGVGLFTGERSALMICPSDVNTGIVFRRMDLPGKPYFPATLDNVLATPRCTVLGRDKYAVHTVEHLLSALKACEVDNALIELEGPEIPILDGSALGFVELFEDSGFELQSAEKKIYRLSSPVFWSQGDVHIVALPSDEYRISYTMHFPQSRSFHSQYYSLEINQKNYRNEIAPCRTFCFYEEIAEMVKKGLIKGGSLDNAVIIKDDTVVNPDGLRFSDEMVRHKILDLIGDLSLIPFSFEAHIIAIRSGHTSNVAFGKDLMNRITSEIS